VPEGWDWVRVQSEPCPWCGFDPPDDLVASARDEAAAWSSWLRGVALDVDLRRRPSPEVWSAIEYACHVRDTLAVFTDRIRRVLVEDEPTFGWWDHEATVVEERYGEADPVVVANAIWSHGAELVSVLSSVPDDGWERRAVRRAGEHFTVVGLARFVLHEAHHHRVDAARSLSP
jgi:hypothetical protein